MCANLLARLCTYTETHTGRIQWSQCLRVWSVPHTLRTNTGLASPISEEGTAIPSTPPSPPLLLRLQPGGGKSESGPFKKAAVPPPRRLAGQCSPNTDAATSKALRMHSRRSAADYGVRTAWTKQRGLIF